MEDAPSSAPSIAAFLAAHTSADTSKALLQRISGDEGEASDLTCASFAQFVLKHKFNLARVMTPLLNELSPDGKYDCFLVCKTLLDVIGYHSERMVLAAAKTIIFEEVRLQTDAGTLYRANSTATTFMTAYARSVGSLYLEKTLGPIIKNLISDSKKGTSYEVDPLKVNKASELKVNAKNFEKLVRKVVKAIVKSAPYLPLGVREICNSLRASITQRFPSANYLVIGGFIFLRFLCPAFLTPSSFMDVQESALTPSVRRAIMLTCKFIQTIANQQNFSKEVYMVPFNPLLDELTPAIREWFDAIAVGRIAATLPPVPLESYLHSLISLSDFIKLETTNLLTYLATSNEDEEETSYFDDRLLLAFLADLAVLASLPVHLPEDKIRQDNYAPEEDSSASSPVPVSLPPHKQKSTNIFTAKRQQSNVKIHHRQAERRRNRAASVASNPAERTGKKWSFKGLMGSKGKAHSVDLTRNEDGSAALYGDMEEKNNADKVSSTPKQCSGSPARTSSAQPWIRRSVNDNAGSSPQLRRGSISLRSQATDLAPNVSPAPLVVTGPVVLIRSEKDENSTEYRTSASDESLLNADDAHEEDTETWRESEGASSERPKLITRGTPSLLSPIHRDSSSSIEASA